MKWWVYKDQGPALSASPWWVKNLKKSKNSKFNPILPGQYEDVFIKVGNMNKLQCTVY